MNVKVKSTLFFLCGMAAVTGCTSEQEGSDVRRMAEQGSVTFEPSMALTAHWDMPDADDWGTTRGFASAEPDGGGVAVIQFADSRPMGSEVTRGSRYEGNNVDGQSYQTLKTSDTFRVSGYRYDPTKGETAADVTEPNFFDNVAVSHNGEWRASGSYYIPTVNDRTDFFAWFVPSGTEGIELNSDKKGGLRLDYSVPATVSKQPDLMTAVTRSDAYSDDPAHMVPLSFRHQLTEVNFVVGEELSPGTIKEIAFTNICTKGTLNVSDGTWSQTEKPTETAYALNFQTFNTSGRRKGETILGGLMMIPQQFTNDNQRIRLKIAIGDEDYTVYAGLSPAKGGAPNGWRAGEVVTYTISSSSLPQLYANTLELSSYSTAMRVDRTRKVTVTKNTSTGALSVKSADPTIATATVASGVVTITGVKLGKTTITVTSAEKGMYAEASKTIDVEVKELVPYEIFTVEGVTFKMIYVEPGTFSNFASKGHSATSNLTVTLTDGYFLGETEVTNALWMAVMKSGNASYTHTSKNNGDNYPVDDVSPTNCQTFLTKLNQLTGETFRLPTEAEWEWAARGGLDSEGYTYAGSNNINDVCWYSGNASSTTHVVKTKQPNELGFYDMSGNVSEWCSDYFGSLPSNTTVVNPTGATSSSTWATRGGGWTYGEAYSQSSYRNWQGDVSNDDHRKGFRIALSD